MENLSLNEQYRQEGRERLDRQEAIKMELLGTLKNHVTVVSAGEIANFKPTVVAIYACHRGWDAMRIATVIPRVEDGRKITVQGYHIQIGLYVIEYKGERAEYEPRSGGYTIDVAEGSDSRLTIKGGDHVVCEIYDNNGVITRRMSPNTIFPFKPTDKFIIELGPTGIVVNNLTSELDALVIGEKHHFF